MNFVIIYHLASNTLVIVTCFVKKIHKMTSKQNKKYLFSTTQPKLHFNNAPDPIPIKRGYFSYIFILTI